MSVCIFLLSLGLPPARSGVGVFYCTAREERERDGGGFAYMRAYLGFGCLTGAGATRAGMPIVAVVVAFIATFAVAVAANAADAASAALACGLDLCALRLPSIATPRLLHLLATFGAAAGRAHGALRKLPGIASSHLAIECRKIGSRATCARLGPFIVCWPELNGIPIAVASYG